MKRAIVRFLARILTSAKTLSFRNVRLGEGLIDGRVCIARNTYINSGFRIVAGPDSKVSIGKFCAIGRNFSCAARTHSFTRPTADEFNEMHEIVEANINIGSYVWIGDNVFVKHGVTIEDYAIIGANSVVTRNIKKFEIVAGAPAKHIRFNTEHYRYSEIKSV